MAMVNKKVQIEFADQRIKAIDEIYDIRKAVESASLNWYSRYGTQLQWPMPFDDRVILEVRIPEEMADNFAFGNRTSSKTDKAHYQHFKRRRLTRGGKMGEIIGNCKTEIVDNVSELNPDGYCSEEDYLSEHIQKNTQMAFEEFIAECKDDRMTTKKVISADVASR